MGELHSECMQCNWLQILPVAHLLCATSHEQLWFPAGWKHFSMTGFNVINSSCPSDASCPTLRLCDKPLPPLEFMHLAVANQKRSIAGRSNNIETAHITHFRDLALQVPVLFRTCSKVPSCPHHDPLTPILTTAVMDPVVHQQLEACRQEEAAIEAKLAADVLHLKQFAVLQLKEVQARQLCDVVPRGMVGVT